MSLIHRIAYPGQHRPIIERDTSDKVQRRLADARSERRTGTGVSEPSLLAGLLFDEHGRAMSPSHASKGGRRYRYYVSQTDGEAAAVPAWRVGAIELERIVCGTIADALAGATQTRIAAGDLSTSAVNDLQANAANASAVLGTASDPKLRSQLLDVVDHIDVLEDSVGITCRLAQLDERLPSDALFLNAPMPFGSVRTRKRERMRIPATDQRDADPATVRLLARAFAARRTLLESPSIDAAATALGYSRDYVAALARLSYLAPALVTDIVDGRISGATSTGPLVRARLPLDWDEQRAMLVPD